MAETHHPAAHDHATQDDARAYTYHGYQEAPVQVLLPLKIVTSAVENQPFLVVSWKLQVF